MQHILFANMTSHVGQITNKKSHLASKVEMTHHLKMTKKVSFYNTNETLFLGSKFKCSQFLKMRLLGAFSNTF